jgi:hypothetical protein
MGDHRGRATPPRPPRRRWRPWLAVLAGALALALGVAACRGGDKPGGVASLGGSATTTTSGSNAGGGKDLNSDLPQLLAWARCMRQHGIDLPDPQLSGDGGIIQRTPRGAGPENPKFKAAEQACRQYQPDGGQPGRPSLQEQQEALAFARCMRQHGIDMSDPQVTAEGIVEQPPTGVDRDDKPRLRAAEQACRQRGGGGK